MESRQDKPAINGTQLSALNDRELVHRAVAGDVAAFDCLVLRHREIVLYTAWSALGDWDRAEDVAQQSLMEAYKGLHGLREQDRFRPWLLTITKRCAMQDHRRRMSEPSMLEFCDAVMLPLVEPEPPPGSQEIREHVKAHLSELSSRSRQVVTLHYLDGHTCREIGDRLSIPGGTVRRILHESRNSLRAMMGVPVESASAKGVCMEMQGIPKDGKLGPRPLVWWINGDWPGHVMDSLLSQSTCLAVNKQAKSIETIGKQVGADPAYVKEQIEPLVAEGLILKKPDEKYIAGMVALDAEDWIEVTQEVRSLGMKVADELETHLPTLEDAWNRTALPAQGFPWSVGIWSALAIPVCNYGISRQHVSDAQSPLHEKSGKRYWPGGREAVGKEHELWCTGFALTTNDLPHLSYGYFWSYGLPRTTVNWPDEHKMAMGAIAEGASDIESLAQRTTWPVEQAREVIAKLIQIGLVRKESDRLALTFPVFRQAESDILSPVADDIAASLTEKILEPAMSALPERLRRLGYGHLEEQFFQWHRWLEGNVCGEALRELLKRGKLPDPGSPAPLTFAFMGWMGDMRLMSWHP